MRTLTVDRWFLMEFLLKLFPSKFTIAGAIIRWTQLENRDEKSDTAGTVDV